MLLSKNLPVLNPRSNILSGKIFSGKSEYFFLNFFHFSRRKEEVEVEEKTMIRDRDI